MSVTSSLATRPLSEHPTCATIAAATALRHTMGRDAQIGGTQSNNASRVAGMYHTRDGRSITVVIEIVASGNEYVYSLTANSSGEHWKSEQGQGTMNDLIEMIRNALFWAHFNRVMDDKSA